MIRLLGVITALGVSAFGGVSTGSDNVSSSQHHPIFALPAKSVDSRPIVPVPHVRPRVWKVPRGIVRAILFVETRSVLLSDDRVRYVDHRVGSHGEIGPTQITPRAFAQVSKRGERFHRLETDMAFALDITERYLLWLRAHTNSWSQAIQAYNAGLNNLPAGVEYRRRVQSVR